MSKCDVFKPTKKQTEALDEVLPELRDLEKLFSKKAKSSSGGSSRGGSSSSRGGSSSSRGGSSSKSSKSTKSTMTSSSKKNVLKNSVYYVYSKLAKIIEHTLLKFGFNTCAYIISKFPKHLLDKTLALLKKQVEQYDEIEKQFTTDISVITDVDDGDNSDDKVIISDKVVGAGVNVAANVAADVKANVEANVAANVAADVKAAIAATIVPNVATQEPVVAMKAAFDSVYVKWNKVKSYTWKLFPDSPKLSGLNNCESLINTIRWGLFCTFIYFNWGLKTFIGINLGGDLASYILVFFMSNEPNKKKTQKHI